MMSVLRNLKSGAPCLLLLLAACTGKSSYLTYEDCILANVKANQTQEAVVAIRQACRGKFPEAPPTQAEIDAKNAAIADEAQTAIDAADAAAAAAEAAADAADAATERPKP